MTELAEHRWSTRVYTEHTDLMGIVYHAHYLYFFEQARTEMLRENGLSLTMMATYDTYFAIHEVQIRYLYPARLDDWLTTTTQCRKNKACGLIFDQKTHNQLGQLISEATVYVVCVNKQLKPKRLPSPLVFN